MQTRCLFLFRIAVSFSLFNSNSRYSGAGYISPFCVPSRVARVPALSKLLAIGDLRILPSFEFGQLHQALHPFPAEIDLARPSGLAFVRQPKRQKISPLLFLNFAYVRTQEGQGLSLVSRAASGQPRCSANVSRFQAPKLPKSGLPACLRDVQPRYIRKLNDHQMLSGRIYTSSTRSPGTGPICFEIDIRRTWSTTCSCPANKAPLLHVMISTHL